MSHIKRTVAKLPAGHQPYARGLVSTSWRGLILIIVAFVATATALNVIIPPYENLDELEHAEVVRHIALTGRLPTHDVAEAEGFHVRQEASQPPLYHILAAGWARVLNLPTTAHRPTPVPEQVVTCGITGTFYNKATWSHAPYSESRWAGAHLTLHGLRAFSTLLQVFTLIGTWTLARRVFPSGAVPLLATGIVAFNPQFLLLAAGVNNDNAVIPLATWGLVLAFDLWTRKLSWRRSLTLGVVCGLAALSKLSGAALLGLGGLALLARLIQKRASLAALLGHGILICVIAGAIVAPWVLRNVRLYDDPTALAPMLDKVGTRTLSNLLGDALLTARSYWGQLPCSFYPRASYWPYLILVTGGLLGIILSWKRLAPREQAGIAMCLVWVGTIALAWARWDMLTPAPGGRLLFPASAALALILAAGWSHWGNRLARAWAVIVPLWALIVLVAGPVTILSPPPLLPESAEAVTPLTAVFDDRIALRGYEARITTSPAECALASDAYCGPILDLTLTWQAQKPIEDNLIMVLQLVTPVPGETELRLNYNHWPGRGNLPTSAWPVGPLIEDRYRLPLGTSVVETQAWQLTLAYVDPVKDRRLPAKLGDAEVGDRVPLALLRVEDRQPSLPETGHLPAPVTFSTDSAEDALMLEEARVDAERDGHWSVTLFWRCRKPVDVDAVTFVHAYNAEHQLLATGDGPPKQGAFPTHLWRPGDRIQSTHTLTLEGDETPSQIAVGLYLRESGDRLPAAQDGTPLTNNAAIVWRRGD
ncbi:MAG: ArnT family glycosyltransferase [Anaerolineae bacterium]